MLGWIGGRFLLRWSLSKNITAGFAVALAILAASEFISYQSTDQLIQNSRELTHAQQVVESLENILVTMDDAETGQRGYLLTDSEHYLSPYEGATGRVDGVLATLQEMISGDPTQQHNYEKLTSLIKKKRQELAATIALNKAGKTQEASRLMMSNEGKKEMDSIRALIARMKDSEKARREARTAQWEASSRRTGWVVASGVVIAFVILLLAILTLNIETGDRIRAERDLRKIQARAKMLADSILDYAIIMLDPEGRIMSWSAGATTILGYAEKEMIGQSFSCFFLPDDVSAGVPQRELERVLVNGRAESESWRVRKGGSRFWSNSVMVAIRDDKGQLQGFSKVTRDITERKQAEEEIQRLNQNLEQRASELEAANKELEAFTYSVSHDLRAPLRHIDGFSQLLVDEYGPHLQQGAGRYLERIQTGARQMGQLVDELLNLTRIGRKEINLQVAGLNSLVEQVIGDLKMELNGRRVEWKIASLPFVECDPTLMRQVFVNLLSNAVKYSRPRDPAVIEVGSLLDKDQPAIFVRDNGVGFNMKYANKLFGVFQRLHRAEDFEGTGIGLATVQRIIHKHGGRIWAEAELDKGATFYFTLGSRAN
jgi:PAS domain S-box-containing protein